MDLAFEDEQMRAVCLTRGRAEALLGPDVARQIGKRIADVRAAETASDLVVGVRLDDRNGTRVLCVKLDAGFEIVLLANHVVNPTTGDGAIDWNEVSRVKVVNIAKVDDL